MANKTALQAFLMMIRSTCQVAYVMWNVPIMESISTQQFKCLSSILQRIRLSHAEAEHADLELEQIKLAYGSVPMIDMVVGAFQGALSMQLTPVPRGTIFQAIMWEFEDLCEEYSVGGQLEMIHSGTAQLNLILQYLKGLPITIVEASSMNERLHALKTNHSGNGVMPIIVAVERILEKVQSHTPPAVITSEEVERIVMQNVAVQLGVHVDEIDHTTVVPDFLVLCSAYVTETGLGPSIMQHDGSILTKQFTVAEAILELAMLEPV